MAAVVVPGEVRRGRFAAQIAIDALVIDVKFADHIFGVTVGEIGHIRGIQAKLSDIERETAEHRDFVEQVRDIVRTFDLTRYMDALEAMRADDVR